MAAPRNTDPRSRTASALAIGCFLWAFGFIASAAAFSYGTGSYGAGAYNVGALDATTTALTSSLNPSTFGSGVTLRATVSPASATGTVTFKDGSTSLGSATLGHASGSLTTAGLAVGSHSLTAVYGGNAAFSGSTSNTVTQTVNKGSTSVSLSPSQNPTSFGQALSLTAYVTPSSATGTLTFKDGLVTLGTATIGHGSGRYVTSALAVGSHSLTVVYGGNANYFTSTSPAVTEVVNTAASSTTILSIIPNPSTYGTSVVFSASVSPSDATGALTIRDGPTTLGTVVLGHDSGSLSYAALGGGAHSITAAYGGNASYDGSTSPEVSHTVNRATATTTLGSSLNPSTDASVVTFTATVTPSSATGTVTFRDGSTTLGASSLSAGTATFDASSLSVGSHAITAVYAGNGNYLSGTSAVLTQVVTAAAGGGTGGGSMPPVSSGGGGGGGGGGHRGAGSNPGLAGTTSSATSSFSSSSTAAGSTLLSVVVEGRTVVFFDVPVSAWFAPYISTLVAQNIARGYRDAAGMLTGEFGVARPVTEAEILKMALQASGKPLGTGAPQNRSAQGDWSAPYVKTAEDLHLYVYGRFLDVRKPATRGQVVQTIVEAFGLPAANAPSTFRDVPPSHPYAAAIAAAQALGIVSGDTDPASRLVGVFRPDAPITRAEVAKLITLAMKAVGK